MITVLTALPIAEVLSIAQPVMLTSPETAALGEGESIATVGGIPLTRGSALLPARLLVANVPSPSHSRSSSEVTLAIVEALCQAPAPPLKNTTAARSS